MHTLIRDAQAANGLSQHNPSSAVRGARATFENSVRELDPVRIQAMRDLDESVEKLSAHVRSVIEEIPKVARRLGTLERPGEP